MPPPAQNRPQPIDDDEFDGDEESAEEVNDSRVALKGPPEEDFDEKYNKHLEFPISIVATVMVHVLIGAFIVFVIFALLNAGADKSGVPVKLVNLEGLDESGEGSSGSGGIDDPAFKSDGDPLEAMKDILPDPTKLPEIKEQMKESLKYLDQTGNMPLSDANAAAYASLNKSVRDKLLGARQGAGPGKGSGYDGSEGKGPGGSGADSTLGRNMRWVLRFKVDSGRSYLEQLKAMGAELLIPEAGSDKCTLIQDLNNPKDVRIASDSDLRRLGNKIKFSDSRTGVVRNLADTLGLGFTPKSIWAFFPKELEDELSKKETGYRNRRSEDIEETVFQVKYRGGGTYDIVVDEQKLKR
jgi:hypothetical protein